MRKKLNKKLCMDDIYEICILTHGNNRKKAHLYQLTFDEDERISTNALWVFTHFDMQNNEWLYITFAKLRLFPEFSKASLDFLHNLPFCRLQSWR